MREEVAGSTGRGRVKISTSEQKKAGRFPVRVREGPAKNLFQKRQKNAQQDTMIQ